MGASDRSRCKGGQKVENEERIAALEEENKRLRDDNEKLMKIVTQLKATLNRLIDHKLLRHEIEN